MPTNETRNTFRWIPYQPKGNALTPLPATIVTTTNAGDHFSLALSGDWRTDIEAAMEEEHGDCESASCDVHEALERGYPLTAAFLLLGSTEAPVLAAVQQAYADADLIPPADALTGFPSSEWEEWTAHHDEWARKCEACSSYTWANGTYEPERCANCLAELAQRLSGEFVLSIELDNDALSEPRDIADLLRKCAYQLENISGGIISGSLVDANGNTVGKYEVEA